MKYFKTATKWILGLFLTAVIPSSPLFAQGTAFTYQGRLADNGSLPSANYDMRFTLYDSPTGGALVAGSSQITTNNVPVNGGLFIVTLNVANELGPDAFNGSPRFLQIEISPHSANTFTTLGARQQLTPTPYAITAANAISLGGQASTAYVAKSGDTMTGTLNLPANGLAVGTNQLVASGGKVGIGTPNPSTPLDILAGGAAVKLTSSNAFYGSSVSLVNNSTGQGSSGAIGFYSGSLANRTGNISANPDGTIHFEAAGSDTLQLSNGVAKLISGTAFYGPNIVLENDLSGQGSSGAISFYSNSANNRTGNISANPDGTMHFEAGGVETMQIQPGGVRLISGTAYYGPSIAIENDYPGQVASGAIGFYSSSLANRTANISVTTDGTIHLAAGDNDYTQISPDGTVTVRVLQISGADVAEPFRIASKDIPKGSVVTIDEDNPGQLRLSDHAYDNHVAGILSGANGVNSGILLKQQGFNDGGQNVALSGRVYALADASYGAIKPGDLLSTSDTPGHCMKVTDHARAQGAIIGKAMGGLKAGKGMVLVLVSLQ
jgi:hypothetical protein